MQTEILPKKDFILKIKGRVDACNLTYHKNPAPLQGSPHGFNQMYISQLS